MSVRLEELDRWEETAVRVNGQMLRALDALGHGDTEKAIACIEEARAMNWDTRKALLRAGARNSIRERAVAALGTTVGLAPDLSLLTSPTNRRYHELLRELHLVALERDKERGWYPDGDAERIAEMLEGVELEVYGPAGRGEG